MSAKKIVIFLVAIFLIGGGLYLVQKDKQKKELAAHNKNKYENLKKGAQKSGAVGVLVMAQAINKFHQDSGRYPGTLLELYPKYISDRGFITTLNWEYTPEKDTYVIQKSAEGQNVFASMGPDLRLRTGVTGVTSPEKVASVPQKDSQGKKSTALVALQSGSGIKNSAADRKSVVRSLPENQKNIQDKAPAKARKEVSKPIPEVHIVKKDLGQNEKFLLSLENNGLYIWKTEDGFIGFSDIQYPDEKKLTIFKDKTWVEYVMDKKNIKK